jgi:tetratricopeptide (TPR) repeat protein
MRTRNLALFAALLLAGSGFARGQEETSAGNPAESRGPAQSEVSSSPDKASAYYHFCLGHIYEEMATVYGRSEFFDQAAEEYKLAIASDPSSTYLASILAELYAKGGRIRDAVLAAQDIINRDPSNLDAHRLLGRIYLRSLGDMQPGKQSSDVLSRALEQYEEIVKLDAGSVDDHLVLGRLYRLSNQTEKAENEFKAALKLQPYSEEAVITLAYLYNEEGNSAEAGALLSGIPDSDRSSRLYSALGYTYEQQKNAKQAIQAYSKAVELDPDNLDAIRGLAENLVSDDQMDAALVQYKSLVEADPQDAQNYLRIAEIYRRTGRLDDALDALKKAQNYVEDSLEVPYHMAVIYAAQGRFDDAIRILQDLIQKSEKPEGTYSASGRNNQALFLERLGGVYRDEGKFPEAIATFRKMLSLGEDSESRGYQEIVDTFKDARQWAEATAAAQEAVAKLPNDRHLKLTLAAQLADMGEENKALAMAKALLQNKSDDREVYISLAEMTSRLKRFKEAEDYIAKADQLAGPPDEKQFVMFVWGDILERQKKFDAAESMFRKVLAEDARNAPVLNYLGYMLADRGVRVQEALGYIKTALEIEPQNGAYLDSLGWAYFKLGDFAQAEENLRHASERMSKDPTVQDHLAEVYAKTGRLKLATMHWEQAIEEWNRSVPAEVDETDFRRVQKELESAKAALAKQQPERKAEAAKP